VGNRPLLRPRLAAAADRSRLAALQYRLMGVDGRRLVLAKRRAVGLGLLPLRLMVLR
jgi:hypothetical protein